MEITDSELKSLLDEFVDKYNRQDFIPDDPIAIPHRFNVKEDIEISGFLTALIAWGSRVAIIKAASSLMDLLDNDPYNFIRNFHKNELNRFNNFVYRTMKPDDVKFLIKALREIWEKHGGLEKLFVSGLRSDDENVFNAISNLRKEFLKTDHLKRSEKHLANPDAGSAAKRINLFLRWMVRSDNRGVDFGIWKRIKTDMLICPLDIHSGNTARALNLLNRKANDRQAALILTKRLKDLDPDDPVKYDFALFGIGVSGVIPKLY